MECDASARIRHVASAGGYHFHEYYERDVNNAIVSLSAIRFPLLWTTRSFSVFPYSVFRRFSPNLGFDIYMQSQRCYMKTKWNDNGPWGGIEFQEESTSSLLVTKDHILYQGIVFHVPPTLSGESIKN